MCKEDTGELIVQFQQGRATVQPAPEVWLDDATVRQLCNAHGHIPVPPYVASEPTALNQYQTVYASNNKEGSVAAPTAGFHFTEELLQALQAKGVLFADVTLHVGAS